MSIAMAAAMAAARAAVLAGGLLGPWAAAPATASGEALEISQPYRLSPHVAPGETHMGIRLLGSVVLTPASVAGLTLGGLSGLAWDEDESRLYALSDRGALFHLRPRFENGQLSGVQLLAAFALRGPDGRALGGRRADAEGLVLQHGDNGVSGDSQLAVAFERYPRIVLFRPDGRHVETLRLPVELAHAGRYAEPNKALESLTWLPTVGFLTAPERPLKASEDGTVNLFALDGRRWRYPLRSNPNASLVDMQALPDGSLLTLERGHGLMFLPMVISLRHTRIPVDNIGERLAVTSLAILDSSQGWSVDNFEGLTRHRALKFFMVSDDNFNALQKTLLVYFERVSVDDGAIRGNASEYEPHQQNRD